MPTRSIEPLPALPGCYLLRVRVDKAFTATAGRLGRLQFRPGWYLYAGSAFGPGGLAARCRRHLRMNKPQHWHIDALTRQCSPDAVWFTTGRREDEADWAQALAADQAFSMPHAGFGASDSRHDSHLFLAKTEPAFSWLRERHAVFTRLQEGGEA